MGKIVELWWIWLIGGAVMVFILLLLIVVLFNKAVTDPHFDDGEEPPDPLMTDQQKIEFNEKLIADDKGWGMGGSFDVSRKLFEHPTIECRFSDLAERMGDEATVNMLMHGVRPAVWRRNMDYPECRSCYVEDPFV